MIRPLRPGYLKLDDMSFMTPMVFFRRWEETPCNTPWLFAHPRGSVPQTQPENCDAYRGFNLGQWVTSDRGRCIMGKELSRADQCDPFFDLCPWGYDWVTEIGCVQQELRT